MPSTPQSQPTHPPASSNRCVEGSSVGRRSTEQTGGSVYAIDRTSILSPPIVTKAFQKPKFGSDGVFQRFPGVVAAALTSIFILLPGVSSAQGSHLCDHTPKQRSDIMATRTRIIADGILRTD